MVNISRQTQFLSQAPFPSDHSPQHWITSTSYVLTSEWFCASLANSRIRNKQSSASCRVISYAPIMSLMLTHAPDIVMLYWSLVHNIWRCLLQDTPTPWDKLPMHLWDFVLPLTSAMHTFRLPSTITSSSWYIITQSSGSRTAHHQAVEKKQHGYSISFNSHWHLNNGDRIMSSQCQSSFKADVCVYKWTSQWCGGYHCWLEVRGISQVPPMAQFLGY